MKAGGLEAPLEFRGRDFKTSSVGAGMLFRDSRLDTADPDTVAFVDAWHEDGVRRRVNLERIWFRNIEFFEGNQWVGWNPSEQLYSPARAPSWRVRYTGNLCAVYAITKAAKILQQRPVVFVYPATPSPEDARIARTAQAVLRYYARVQGHQYRAISDFVYWLIITGLGVFRWGWDPLAGPLRELPPNHDGLVPPEIARRLWGDVKRKPGEDRSFAVGEPYLRAVSPFHVFPDPAATSWDSCRWIMEASRKPLDWFSDRWGKKGDLVEPEGTSDTHDFYEQRIRDVDSYRSYMTESQPDLPSAVVKELWVKPCRRYPRGYYVITAGQWVLERGELPEWCEGGLPYSTAFDKPTPGKLWPDATFNDIVPPQKGRNRAVSMVIENGNVVGSPPLLLPAQCRVNEKDVTGGPGNIIPYFAIGGHRPEYLQPAALPDYVKSLPDAFERDVMLIAGMNEPTLGGRAPPNVRTASGLAQLMQQDDARLVVEVEAFNGALSRGYAGFLRVCAELVAEERLATITEDSRVDLMRFTGKDLVGEQGQRIGANYFNVDARIDAGFKSRAATQEFLLNLSAGGIIRVDNDEERRWLVREMRIGADDDAIFGSVLRREEQARLENVLLAHATEEGFASPLVQSRLGPWEWDDHEVHIAAHLDYMRRTAFVELVAANQQVAMRFQEHLREHETNMQMEILKQAGIAAPMMGPGPAGQPPLAPGQKNPGDPGVALAKLKGGSRPGVGEAPRQPRPPELDRGVPFTR